MTRTYATERIMHDLTHVRRDPQQKPLYSVGTWDMDLQAYTPQAGAGRCINITKARLRVVLKWLRNHGYTAHRVRFSIGLGDHDHDSDPSVLVERTDGMTKAEILEGWKR